MINKYHNIDKESREDDLTNSKSDTLLLVEILFKGHEFTHTYEISLNYHKKLLI